MKPIRRYYWACEWLQRGANNGKLRTVSRGQVPLYFTKKMAAASCFPDQRAVKVAVTIERVIRWT